MRQFLLGLFALIFISSVHATEPERIERLASKVVLADKNAYYVLSDGSFWKVVHFETRWRSVYEWWNDVKLVPENYESLPSDWFLGTEVEVYAKYPNLEISEADASNELDLRQCTHLLYNARTGQILFAIALDPAESILRLYDDAREDGYNSGYYEGYQKGYALPRVCPTCGCNS